MNILTNQRHEKNLRNKNHDIRGKYLNKTKSQELVSLLNEPESIRGREQYANFLKMKEDKILVYLKILKLQESKLQLSFEKGLRNWLAASKIEKQEEYIDPKDIEIYVLYLVRMLKNLAKDVQLQKKPNYAKYKKLVNILIEKAHLIDEYTYFDLREKYKNDSLIDEGTLIDLLRRKPRAPEQGLIDIKKDFSSIKKIYGSEEFCKDYIVKSFAVKNPKSPKLAFQNANKKYKRMCEKYKGNKILTKPVIERFVLALTQKDVEGFFEDFLKKYEDIKNSFGGDEKLDQNIVAERGEECSESSLIRNALIYNFNTAEDYIVDYKEKYEKIENFFKGNDLVKPGSIRYAIEHNKKKDPIEVIQNALNIAEKLIDNKTSIFSPSVAFRIALTNASDPAFFKQNILKVRPLLEQENEDKFFTLSDLDYFALNNVETAKESMKTARKNVEIYEAIYKENKYIDREIIKTIAISSPISIQSILEEMDELFENLSKKYTDDNDITPGLIRLCIVGYRKDALMILERIKHLFVEIIEKRKENISRGKLRSLIQSNISALRKRDFQEDEYIQMLLKKKKL